MKFPERIVPGAQDLNTALDARDLDADSRFSDQLPRDLSVVRYRLHDLSLLKAGRVEPLTTHSRLNAGDIRLNRSVDRHATAMEVVGDGLPRYWFGLVNRGSLRVSQGTHTAVSSGTMGSALRALPGTRVLSSDDSLRTNLSVEAHALERALAALLDDEPSGSLVFRPVVDWSRGLAGSVPVLMDCLVNDAKRPDGLLANELAFASFSDALLRTILLGLPHSHSDCLAGIGRAAQSHPVRRAEAFMRAHADQPLRMAEVAAAAGCSLRTLEASFERVRSMTPLAALREVRLDRVREVLQRDDSDTVGAVARRFGFTNGGRFATAYARRFGEHPSDTARRSR